MTLATVTFPNAWVTAPVVTVTPIATGGALNPRVASSSTTTFVLACDVAPSGSTSYSFNYICLG